MAQQIANDPLARKTFAYDEDNWDTEHNKNWTQTVDQINDVQRLILGSATEASLTNYSDDDIATRLDDIDQTNSDQDNRIETVENDLPDKANFSLVKDLAEQTAVATTAANSSGDTTLSLQTATAVQLIDEDTLIIYDPEAESAQTATVSGTHTDVTSITLAGPLAAPTDAGFLVLLSPADQRRSINQGALKDAVWGNLGPEEVERNHETRIRELSTQIGGLASAVQAATALADGAQNSVTELEGTITSIETTAEEAALQAETFEVADTPTLALDRKYDEESANALDVRWKAGAPSSGLDQGDVFALRSKDGTATLLTLGADAEVNDATVTLDKSYTIDAQEGAKMYMTTTTVASKISARTDGDISVRSKALRTAQFDGSIVENGDGLYVFERDGNGEPLIGTTGWALTSGGEVGANNVFLRGRFDVEEGTIDGPLIMTGGDSKIENAAGTYLIDNSGMDFIGDFSSVATDHKTVNISGRQTTTKSVNASSPTVVVPWTNQQILPDSNDGIHEAEGVVINGTSNVAEFEIETGSFSNIERTANLYIGARKSGETGHRRVASREVDLEPNEVKTYTLQFPGQEWDDLWISAYEGEPTNYDPPDDLKGRVRVKAYAPSVSLSGAGLFADFGDGKYFQAEMGKVEVGGEFNVDGNAKATEFTSLNGFRSILGKVDTYTADFNTLEARTVYFHNIPTTDPQDSGKLYREGNDLKISTG